MSLRLTLSFDAEHQAVIDSLAQLLKGAGISVEVSNHMVDGWDRAVAHHSRDAQGQRDGEHPAAMANGGEAVEGQDWRPIIHRDGSYSALAGNLV